MNKILISIFGILFLVVINSFIVDAVVCCEKLRGSAEYCVNVQIENSCDSNFDFYQGRNCERVANCQIGCCVTENSGTCINDQNRISCEGNSGFWISGGCNDVDVCQQGCCFLSSNTFFSSEGECRRMGADLGLDADFRTGFDDDTECQEELNRILGNEEKGCCVSLDGDCSYGIRSACTEGQQFRTGGYCMDINVCRCESSYSCVNNKKDVYQTSNCGDEKIVEECDEINTYCGFVRSDNQDRSSLIYGRGNSYYWEIGLGREHIPGSTGEIRGVGCTPFGCRSGQSFIYDYNRDGLFNEERIPNQIITITNEMLGGRNRQHGESWCINPSEPNQPGSRYYVFRCDKGKIVSEGCSPSRLGSPDRQGDEGVCRETTDGEFTEARCVDSGWTKQEARDNPNRIVYPPAIQFYQGTNLGAVSVKDSCSYCNKKDSWWRPWDMCDSNMCGALGDCNFDDDSFGLWGCVKGAVIAEALWLTAGSIAIRGENVGGIAQGSSFENTGWQGFWDSGPLSDWGDNMVANNNIRVAASNPEFINSGTIASQTLTKPNMQITGLQNGQKGLWYTDAEGALGFTSSKSKALALGLNANPSPGVISTYGTRIVEGVAIQQGVGVASGWLTDDEPPVQQPAVSGGNSPESGTGPLPGGSSSNYDINIDPASGRPIGTQNLDSGQTRGADSYFELAGSTDTGIVFPPGHVNELIQRGQTSFVNTGSDAVTVIINNAQITLEPQKGYDPQTGDYFDYNG